MTLRFKVLLVSGLAMALVLLLGGVIYKGAINSRAFRHQGLSIQERLDGITELDIEARRYLQALLHAKDRGADTSALLGGVLQDIDHREARLRLLVGEGLEGEERALRQSKWSEVEEILQSLRRWASEVEATVRQLPPEASLIAQEWKLLEEYERTVGRQLVEERRREYEEKARMLAAGEAGLRLHTKVALLAPCAALLLLVVLTLATLVPMNRAWRTLVGALGKLGEGNLEIALSEKRRDELGVLARAFNKMARELKLSLEEKQRLLKAEAEAREQEVRRYNMLLEETVRTRTAELEQANTRLTESLQQLQATQDQLIFADRLAAMGRLAAGVGHEINNPLSYVISNLSFLHGEMVRIQGAPTQAEREEMMEVLSAAREGAERVRVIVKDLKTLARPEESSSDRAELGQVVRSAAKLAANELRYRARLLEDCGGVPPVRGNEARLGQVFLNLIINAAHAIPPGRSHENEVRVVARQTAPDRVTVEVSDTGSGISPEHLRRIFEPFFTTKPVGLGTGLGLSVCHSIIVGLGGELDVRSEEGKGTTFLVTLPVAAPAPTVIEATAGGQASPGSGG
ncbi:MAG: HAMP domain-containing protein [Myxococcaceae bacterium]|nr:HAMP domain-containing protein [Myxococcaceae bacterium]